MYKRQIQDDGKIFLLFMVAFAIMVISARTGASGTQLSKIRASHSLGATNRQILRYVILPIAWPGVVTVGLFASRGADFCLLGSDEGVQTLDYRSNG